MQEHCEKDLVFQKIVSRADEWDWVGLKSFGTAKGTSHCVKRQPVE